MVGEKPASFPFFYIEPAKASNVPLVEKFTGKLTRAQVESIPPIGKPYCQQVILQTLGQMKICSGFAITLKIASEVSLFLRLSLTDLLSSKFVLWLLAGNAPTLLSYSDLHKVAETWMNTSHAIFDDEESHKVSLPSLQMRSAITLHNVWLNWSLSWGRGN